MEVTRPDAEAGRGGSIVGMSGAGDLVRPMLEGVAVPERAPAMAAYMKGIAPYLGVPTPARRTATKDWIRGFDPGPGGHPPAGGAHELMTEPEREFAYVGIDLVVRHERSCRSRACWRCAHWPSNGRGGTRWTHGRP